MPYYNAFPIFVFDGNIFNPFLLKEISKQKEKRKVQKIKIALRIKQM
jgi:hypothetical protein